MKLTTFILLACSLSLISYVTAGPGSAGGSAPLQGVNDTGVAAVKIPSNVGPGFNARDSAGGQSDQVGQPIASGAASAGNASSGSNPSSDGNGSALGRTNSNLSPGGFQPVNPNSASNFIGHREEKVIDTGERGAETRAAEKASEVDPRFKGSLLDQGLPSIPNSHANERAVEKVAAINPVTGEPIPPRPSFSVPPNNPPPISPIPHATVPPQVPEPAGISPIPKATVSVRE